MSVTDLYRSTRDQLFALRGQQEKAATEFTWPDFEGAFNWAVDWFDAFARGNLAPGLIVVEEDGSRQELSFDELARRSDHVAAWLQRTGVSAGDVVLLMLGNQVELWETMLGIMKAGAVILPTTTAIGSADLRDRVDRGHVGFVICNPADAAKFDSVPGDYGRICAGPQVGWNDLGEAYRSEAEPAAHPGTVAGDPLLLYFTSGTTSRPKLVEHTQISYPVGHMATMYWLGLQPGDRHLNISSPGWAKHAWSCFFAPWIAEATVVVCNYARFEPAALLAQLDRLGITSFCAPPTVWRMLINADLSAGPGALREVISAGEPLNPEVIQQVRGAWGLTIRDGYGQTETSAQIGNAPEELVKVGSMGRPLPGVPVVLLDPVTQERADGVAEGEICLDLGANPLCLMTGYQGDAERNDSAMTGGFYHTGDVARRDEDSYLTFIGRTDDVFKASDYKISPFELESVLIEHPAVAEAAVVPAPDPLRLAVPKAYIALAPGHEPTDETAFEILKYAREHLAPYLRVRRIEFYELPKTISGKIRRVELRARESQLAQSHEQSPDEWRDDQFPGLRS